MRKSGLHKQISSIFDGAAVPKQNNTVKALQNTDSLQEDIPVNTGTSQEPQSAKPSDTPAAGPSLSAKRPEPLPKKKLNHDASSPNISKMVQQTVFGSQKKITPHQKKMTVLVGILSIVFGVVLYVSMGGVGQSQTIAAERDDDDAAPATASTSKVTPETWMLPEPVPADLRDATKPEPKSTLNPDNAEQTTDPEEITEPETIELQVRGIVYSKTKPSAIINDKVYTVGESINGITIIEITRDDVTFEGNGESWTQQVQR